MMNRAKCYDIMSAREKQATPKATFVFLAPLTSKQPARAGDRALEARVYESNTKQIESAKCKICFTEEDR